MEHNTIDSMGCDSCKGHSGMHSPVRVLTAVIVIIFVFWCGFEFGSMHEYARGGFDRGGYGMMGNWGYVSGSPVQGMRVYQNEVVPANGTATNGATTAAPAAK